MEQYEKLANYGGTIISIQGKLVSIIKCLEEFREEIVYKAPHIITIDFFVKAILDSASNIDLGFKDMIDKHNYFCAIPMIRMQLDNAMVALAGLIAKDVNQFFVKFANGVAVKDQKDYEGKLMTSRNLSKELDKLFVGSKDLYDKTCKYVHPSSVALQSSWFESEERKFRVKGFREVTPYKYSEYEIVGDYVNACLALFTVLDKWAEAKDQEARLHKRIEDGTQEEVDNTTSVAQQIIQSLLHR